MSLARDNEIKFYRPLNINDLDGIIEANKKELTFVAGTTDLMVLEQQWEKSNNIVDLSCVKELSQNIETQSNGVLIGASVPMSVIIDHSIIKEKFPILIEALGRVGSEQIQNRATLGGNIANASPAGDSLPILNVLDAQLWIGPRKNGEFEKIPVADLMIGPDETSLKMNQYIGFIFLPEIGTDNLFWYFRKVGQREALAISKLSLAVLGWFENEKVKDIRISAGAVTAQVKRATKTESVLKNKVLNEELIEKAKKSLEDEVAPITDIRSNMKYRKHICGELLRDALYQLYSEKNK